MMPLNSPAALKAAKLIKDQGTAIYTNAAYMLENLLKQVLSLTYKELTISIKTGINANATNLPGRQNPL
jgi:hypothetical protein